MNRISHQISHYLNHQLSRHFSRQLVVLLILSMSLGLSYLLWKHEKNNALLEVRATLDFNVRDISGRIQQRMASSEQVLRGAQGVFTISESVQRKDFANYINMLQLGADHAGMEGVGIILSVASDSFEQHIAVMRQQTSGEYQIYPLPNPAITFAAPIIQLEPAIGRNRKMLGFDTYSDPRQKVAMERARDSGAIAVTAMLKLPAADNVPAQNGFYIYLPIYKDGSPHDTQETRRANLLGWVFAPFRVAEVMASLYGENPRATDICIYDGVEPTAANLMYDSATLRRDASVTKPARLDLNKVIKPQLLQATEYVSNGGRSWTIVMTSSSGVEKAIGSDKSTLIAASGILLSALLSVLAWVLLSGRERALTLAREMTKELRESEARFRYLAQYDELSGLPNRAMFKDRLRHAIVQAKRDKSLLALMYLDLDKFKPINDNLGHHVGDMLLRAVAERMQQCVRESDTVARMGGDEFMILLPVIELEQDALLVAEKIRAAISEPFEVSGGHILQVSCSIGIALYPQHGNDEIELSKNADNAMYRAKELGRDRVKVFDPA